MVGGGIVGVATCYYASMHGSRATLIERDEIASHASGFAFGGLHPRVENPVHSQMNDFAIASFDEHQRLDQLLRNNDCATSTWRMNESVALARDEQEATLMREACSKPSSHASWVDATELNKLEPRLCGTIPGGALTTQSAEVNAKHLTTAMYELANPTLISKEVVGCTLKQDKLVGVTLDDGTSIEGDCFVFAMGPWTSTALQWFGLAPAISPLKGQILRLRMAAAPFLHSFSIAGNYMSSKPDDLVWGGTTEESTGFDETTTPKAAQEIRTVLNHMTDALKNSEVELQTACLRPISADGNLILGAVPNYPNAYIASGGGRKGILYGPLMGKHIADQLANPTLAKAWEAFTPARFVPD